MKTSRISEMSPGRSDFHAVRAEVEREFSQVSRRDPKTFQLTLNEAEALAWQTGTLAHLVFPALAEEKARALAAWQDRQRWIRGELAGVSLAE